MLRITTRCMVPPAKIARKPAVAPKKNLPQQPSVVENIQNMIDGLQKPVRSSEAKAYTYMFEQLMHRLYQKDGEEALRMFVDPQNCEAHQRKRQYLKDCAKKINASKAVYNNLCQLDLTHCKPSEKYFLQCMRYCFENGDICATDLWKQKVAALNQINIPVARKIVPLQELIQYAHQQAIRQGHEHTAGMLLKIKTIQQTKDLHDMLHHLEVSLQQDKQVIHEADTHVFSWGSILSCLLTYHEKIFDLHYEPIDAPTWDEKVVLYDVSIGSGKHKRSIAKLFIDIEQRSGKQMPDSHGRYIKLEPGLAGSCLPVGVLLADIKPDAHDRVDIHDTDTLCSLLGQFYNHVLLGQQTLVHFGMLYQHADFNHVLPYMLEYAFYQHHVLSKFLQDNDINLVLAQKKRIYRQQQEKHLFYARTWLEIFQSNPDDMQDDAFKHIIDKTSSPGVLKDILTYHQKHHHRYHMEHLISHAIAQTYLRRFANDTETTPHIWQEICDILHKGYFFMVLRAIKNVS